MSTKVSIAFAKGVHFYKDCFDEDGVFLELKNVFFQAGPDGITVKIPLATWEYLRSFAAVDLSIAAKSDDELAQQAQVEIDDRQARYLSAPPPTRDLLGLEAVLVMGHPESPREEQIAVYFAHLKRQRDQQRSIIEAIENLKKVL